MSTKSTKSTKSTMSTMSSMSSMSSMTPVGTGITLGLVNTVVVALGLAVAIGDPIAEVVSSVVILGFIPGMILGAIAGGLAGIFATRPTWIRIPLIAFLPILFVLGVGTLVDISDAAAGACIPTMVATLMLERATRSPPVAPLVPIARVT